MKLKIELRYYPDPILTTLCAEVTQEEWEKYWKKTVPVMEKILLDNKGLGLAANQVGIPRKFFIMRECDDPDTERWGSIRVIVNPEIIEAYEDTTFSEGCLSLPGVKVKMDRKKFVELKFRDENWNECHGIFCYPESIVVQHEMDHLAGMTLLTNLSKGMQKMYIKKINKFKKLMGV